MPTDIQRDQVRRLLEDGAQLIEVLPAEDYEAEHIPRAISIPLKQLNRTTAAHLRRDRPIVVYCADSERDMSSRAAWRLESLGFERVVDYVAGKADWFAAGLPRAGERAELVRAGDCARHDVPTCSLAEQIGSVRERVKSAGWDTCVVVN